MITVRHIRPEDLDHIDAIGTASYPANYYEDPASFWSKIAGYPAGVWVAELTGELAGYVIGFPYLRGQIHPINALYTAIERPNCFYIHDLCVAKEYRGQGVANAMAQKALEHAWPITALVAVNDSRRFWAKYGFTDIHALDYYGLPAMYMLRER